MRARLSGNNNIIQNRKLSACSATRSEIHITSASSSKRDFLTPKLPNTMSQDEQEDFALHFSQYEQEFGTYSQPQILQPRPTHKITSIKSKDWNTPHPDASFITPEVASSTMKQFLASTVADEGFEKAEPTALYRFELEVVACTLYQLIRGFRAKC